MRPPALTSSSQDVVASTVALIPIPNSTDTKNMNTYSTEDINDTFEYLAKLLAVAVGASAIARVSTPPRCRHQTVCAAVILRNMLHLVLKATVS